MKWSEEFPNDCHRCHAGLRYDESIRIEDGWAYHLNCGHNRIVGWTIWLVPLAFVLALIWLGSDGQYGVKMGLTSLIVFSWWAWNVHDPDRPAKQTVMMR